MSAKPTPGPYEIRPIDSFTSEQKSFAVLGPGGKPIATFWGPHFNNNATTEQAEANARAWVEGREAMEKLRRMRALYVDKRDDELFSVAIEVKHILDEP